MTLIEASERWVLGLISRDPSATIPQFLIHSYRYYLMDAPVLGDETFDFMARLMVQRFHVLSHPHKGLIDPSLGKTGFYLKETDYPGRAVACAVGWERLLLASTSSLGRLKGA